MFRSIVSLDLDGTVAFGSLEPTAAVLVEIHKIRSVPGVILLLNTGRRFSYFPKGIPCTFSSAENGIFLRKERNFLFFLDYNWMPFALFPVTWLVSFLFDGKNNSGRKGSIIGKPKVKMPFLNMNFDGKRNVYSLISRNKLSPVAYLQKKYEIADSNVYVMGDDLNDLPLFLMEKYRKYTYLNTPVAKEMFDTRDLTITELKDERSCIRLLGKMLADLSSTHSS